MAGMELDAETAHQAAVDVLNAKESTDGNLDTLRALLEDLAAAWTGRAGTSLQNVMTTWDAEAAKLLEALQQIADNLDASATASTEQDEEAASSLSQYEGDL